MKHTFKDISIAERIRCHSFHESVVTGIGIVCLAMLMCLCAEPIQQGWNEYDMFLCNSISLIAVMGMAACFMTKSNLRLGLTDALILILYGYFIIRYYTDETYPAESMAIHATLAFGLYFSLRLMMSGTRISGNIIALLILAYTIYEVGYGIVQLIDGTSRHYRYPVTGSFHNPGPYSACLVMGLAILCNQICKDGPLTLSGVFKTCQRHVPTQSESEKLMSIESVCIQILVIIFASLIIITMSRTAILAAALCLFILFWGYMGRWKWFIMGLCIASCVGLYFLKSGSADGRMVINYVGTYAMADNPIFGNGVGSFFHRYAETTHELSLSGTKIDLTAVDVIEYAFNDWLHIAMELGVVGFLLTAAIVTYTLCLLWKRCLPLFLTLLVVLIFSFFSYPIELLPYRIITILIIAFTASQTKQFQTGSKKKFAKTTLITVAIVACISFSQPNRIETLAQAENDYNMMRGIDDPALIKDYAMMLPLLEDNRNFLFDYGRILAKVGRYNDSNDVLRRGSMISNDPMFLVLQGNNYRDMEAFDKAEEMYLKAWRTMPNRIYPLYRLMLIYQQIGNDEKSKVYAKIIIDFKEKIHSPAVRDIKREALEIINNTGI